ncbi:hypothetical protein GCM10009772_08550 [Pseudonocardia alni subsp. carboxydivorans]
MSVVRSRNDHCQAGPRTSVGRGPGPHREGAVVGDIAGKFDKAYEGKGVEELADAPVDR